MGVKLTLREVHRLKVFENRVVRRICGLKRGKIIGCRRKVHNEELDNLYLLPNTGVRMKGIQKNNYLRKHLSYKFMGYTITKGNYQSFFF
jgi:hypothetical protein